jgi:hypothetical protein
MHTGAGMCMTRTLHTTSQWACTCLLLVLCRVPPNTTLPRLCAGCVAAPLQVEQLMAEQQRLLQCVPAAAVAAAAVPCGGDLVGSLLSQDVTADEVQVSASEWPQLCKVGCWGAGVMQQPAVFSGAPPWPVSGTHACHMSANACHTSARLFYSEMHFHLPN